jgi:serine phosphatase RsbU (regulator of sigma subunit)/tetratricopeptide (TPR) repeat protein
MKIRVLAIIICLAITSYLNYVNGQDRWDETLRVNLKTSDLYKKSGEKENEAMILNIIAGNYFNEGLYKKAALYYEQEFSLYEKENTGKLASSSEMAAKSYFNLLLDSLSSVWYAAAASYYESAGDAAGLLRCREKLGQLHIQLGVYDEALNEYEKIIDSYSRVNDNRNLAETYNQIGFLMFRKNDINEALASFTKAIEFSEKGGRNDFFLTDVWSNKAICYQNLENKTEMLACFRKALEYAKNSDRTDEAARIERIMAMIYFKDRDNYHAEVYCLSCIESAKKSGNLDVLQLCYHDYSDVLESGNDFIKALEYYEKHLNLRDSLNYEKRIAEQNAADKITEYEAIEQRIKEELAKEEIQDLELRNLRVEQQRRENEITLLLKQKELDKSEKERLADSLDLEKERYELNRRKQDIISLQKQQEYDSLALRQKDIEAVALQTKNQLLEAQKKQQEDEAEKQKQIRKMAVGLGILMALVAIMILAGLISTRKKNQKLAESKRQIEKINADLEQTNAEVLTQKEIIEQKNQSITDSIQYASRIQTAVLPPVNFLEEWGLENFILFKPKDIVSGDFYWGVKKDGKIIVAAADCTGHGVPGAFMSMLGHAFLDEIVNTRELTDAATILNILRDEIINTLKQKGTTGETRDGMDISLVILDMKGGYLDYAGANNPLYLIRDTRMLKYQADNMPIGIHFVSFTPFTNNRIEIKKGDYVYLFSDGYADQFGGPRGKKFMYKPFQTLLIQNCSMPLHIQKEILEDTFERWRNGREQVDDVMVIGIHI